MTNDLILSKDLVFIRSGNSLRLAEARSGLGVRG